MELNTLLSYIPSGFWITDKKGINKEKVTISENPLKIIKKKETKI